VSRYDARSGPTTCRSSLPRGFPRERFRGCPRHLTAGIEEGARPAVCHENLMGRSRPDEGPGRGRRAHRRADAPRCAGSDVDKAIERAQTVQEETVERLEEEGIDAAGDTGEADPMVAIEDALQTFPADRIVIFSHPDDERAYREEELDEAGRRFGIPVTRGTISS